MKNYVRLLWTRYNPAVFALMAFMAVLSARAQITSLRNTQTPEAANLGTYGNIPVGLYTGTPEISVPLHTLKTGEYTLPIELSYHLSNVRPYPSPGVTGLGWTLLAGGCITRNVRGYYDEKKDYSGYGYGFMYNYGKLGSITGEQSFRSRLNDVFMRFQSTDGSKPYDLEADEFFFNFCGYTGNFYLDEHGNWCVASDTDIKVEPTTDSDFVSLQQLRDSGRMNTTGWAMSSSNNRFLNKFTLVTPDGCRYRFGGLTATEYSISYYNRNGSDLIPTTWHLTRIDTPDGHYVDFTYDCTYGGRAVIQCDIRYSPHYEQWGTYKSSINGIQNGTSRSATGWDAFTGFLLFPTFLKSVSSSIETVSLSYSSDSNYPTRLVGSNNAVKAVLYIKNPRDVFSRYGWFNPAGQFMVFMDGVPYPQTQNDENATRLAVANRMKDLKLTGMTISSKFGGDTKSVSLEYAQSDTTRRKLTRVSISGNNALKKWRFTYYNATNDERMSSRYTMARTDSWGYYSGTDVVVSSTPTYQYRPPSLMATRAETLKSVAYPTGGESEFSYELNTYSCTVAPGRTSLLSGGGTAGGLRVSKIVDRDGNGGAIRVRRFYYCKEIADSVQTISKSSGILREPVTHVKYLNGRRNNVFTVLACSEEVFRMPVTLSNSPNVGYSWVIENTMDGSGATLGWVRHRFYNYDTDMSGTAHPDEPCLYSIVDADSTVYAPYTSRSSERGHPMSEEYFSPSGQLVRKTCHERSFISGDPIRTIHNDMSYYEDYMNSGNASYLQGAHMTYTHTRRFFETCTTDTVYTPSGVKTGRGSTVYNQFKLPSVNIECNSDGSHKSVSYTYPNELAGVGGTVYGWMNMRHIYLPPQAVRTEEGGELVSKTVNEFRQRDSLAYIGVRKVFFDDSLTLGRTEDSIVCADRHCNPVIIEKDGLRSLILWSFGGQRVIARIDNIPMSVMSTGFNTTWMYALSDKTPAASDYADILTLASMYPDCQLTVYRYDRNLRLESVTNPAGMTLYYKYDGLGRLREEYCYDGSGTRHVLKWYDYRYVQY